MTLFIIGVVVALAIEEFTGISPGGVIVPGFLSLYIHEPLTLGATLLASIVVYLFMLQLQKFMLLYGRRRFGYAILTGVVIKSIMSQLLPKLRMAPYGHLIVGLVIPGLIAENFLRQGFLKTLLAMVAAIGITRLASIAVIGWAP